jgi:hypothetical protein
MSASRLGLAALVVTVTSSGCLGGLDAPFSANRGEFECSADRADRYLSAAGTAADHGIVVLDTDPPPAISLVHDDANEPGLAVIGSAQEGDYRFYILNSPAIQEGSAEVVRSSIDQPSGIRLILELDRRALGSVQLDSLAGEITFSQVGESELAGSFEAALGTLADEFEGCFHVDVLAPHDAP